MDAELIHDMFLIEFAERAQAPITPHSALEFFRVMHSGAHRMVHEGRTGEGDIAEAMDNLQTFLEEMESERLRIGPDAYHETTVRAATDRWCPGLWPFC